MPTGSVTPAGAFNGGTITNELVIDTGAATDQALELQGTRTTELDVLKIDYPHMALEIDSGGFTEITSDNGATLVLKATADSTALLGLTNEPTVSSVLMDAEPGGAVVQVTGAGGTVAAALDGFQGVLIAVPTAPADANISVGAAYLWFDRTNGASKLMVKGKSANGTVVAAAIALA
jgi:hypothetical protein